MWIWNHFTTQGYAVRRFFWGFTAALMMAAPFPARAASPDIQAAETSVRLGVSTGYGDDQATSPQDAQTGALVGVTAGVSSLRQGAWPGFLLPDLYADAGYDFSAGFLNDRGTPGARAGAQGQGQDNAYYNTAIVRLGAGAPIGGGREVIPYIAGGYQKWYRNLTGPSGYGAFYKSELIGGGVKMDVAGTPVLVVQATAEAFAVIGGSASVPSQNFNANFGASAEERVSLDADYRLTPTWHAFAGLGLTHYDYAGSKADAAGLFEPLSATLQVNSMFGIAYGF
jgi:hypothetical protein